MIARFRFSDKILWYRYYHGGWTSSIRWRSNRKSADDLSNMVWHRRKLDVEIFPRNPQFFLGRFFFLWIIFVFEELGAFSLNSLRQFSSIWWAMKCIIQKIAKTRITLSKSLSVMEHHTKYVSRRWIFQNYRQMWVEYLNFSFIFALPLSSYDLII